jgi:hypothetical protein
MGVGDLLCVSAEVNFAWESGARGRVGRNFLCILGSEGWGRRCGGHSDVFWYEGVRPCVAGRGAGDCGGYAVVSQLYALFSPGVHSPEMEADFGDLLKNPNAELRGTAGNVRKRLAAFGRDHVDRQKKHIPENIREVRRRRGRIVAVGVCALL